MVKLPTQPSEVLAQSFCDFGLQKGCQLTSKCGMRVPKELGFVSGFSCLSPSLFVPAGIGSRHSGRQAAGPGQAKMGFVPIGSNLVLRGEMKCQTAKTPA